MLLPGDKGEPGSQTWQRGKEERRRTEEKEFVLVKDITTPEKTNALMTLGWIYSHLSPTISANGGQQHENMKK